MTSSCCVIMGCRGRTLADDTVNFKLALQSLGGLSVSRIASLCQLAPWMEPDIAIFSKLPCHWQSCSYLANNQAGNQTVLNCQFRTRESPMSPFNCGEKRRSPPTTLVDFFIYIFTCLFVCLVVFPLVRVLQSPQGGPNSDSAVMGKWGWAFSNGPRVVASMQHRACSPYLVLSRSERWPGRMILVFSRRTNVCLQLCLGSISMQGLQDVCGK